MKRKKDSPVRLAQTKITAFCSASGKNFQNSDLRVNRKRKNEVEVSEVHEKPVKKVASQDVLSVSPKNLNENGCNQKTIDVETNFENLTFEDFENDPFLSPKKKESPKKKVLTENSSENKVWLGGISEVSFETLVKCRVIKTTFVTDGFFENVLVVGDVKSRKIGICKLRDVWTSFSISVDDIVCIKAVHTEGHWVVDNKNGFVILHPDMIVSSTMLVRSMFCMRQGIFSNYFREKNFDDNKMLIGRLVHEFFQESLRLAACSDEDFHKIITDFMQQRKNLHDFFFSNLKVSEIQKEMKNYIPHVRNFLDVYINKQATPADKNFDGTIDDVMDIEELIKSPMLGCQGRIDVTVRVKSKNVEKIAPLELKTGKASFSREHRSQLVLYILLLRELGRKVDSGLLLYLKEDVMEEIFPERDDIRNLLLLRNHFTDFLKKFGSCVLPEPIRNVKCCMKCPHLKICTTYLKADKLVESHPLKSIEVPDVKASHVDYFLKWSKMLCVEYEEVFKEITDECEISNLQLDSNVENINDKFKHTFRKENESKQTFQPGTFVHVLDGKNNRLCSGQIFEIDDFFVSVLTDSKLNFSEFYKLVINKSNFLSFYLSNLGWLLNEEFQSLRELIIDKREPGFEKSFDKADFREKCLNLVLNLNKDQRTAVLKSLLCQNYLLIKGPPGTGKSQTILTLVKILLALNKTVLLASHTHSSVDNILLKLDGVKYLRLGSLKSVRKEIHNNCYDFLIENCSVVENIQKLFERKLIASTCLGIDADFVRKIKVEYCIVDESSQVLQPEILRPLFCCKKFILVGDENQLPPVVRNPEAKKLGMDESMFELLNTERAIVRLRLQYRMNAVINSLANAITYGGLIECGNDEVANATMKIPNREAYSREEEWIIDILSDDLGKSVVFVDTSEYFRLENRRLHKKRSSALEANIILRLINCLINFGIKQESVGVIAPFWDQINLLKSKLEKNNLKEIELNTVEQYQGRDKEVILFSCTKENQSHKEATETELLNDERRLTVAVTRAKHKLIITGDRGTVDRYKPFQKLIKSLRPSQFYCLSNGRQNFFWENF